MSGPKLVLPDGSLASPTETTPEAAAPTGPPGGVERPIPQWFRPVHDYLKGFVSDEALVLDLCLERCVEILEWNHNSKMVGIDFFPEATGGSAPTRMAFVASAVPLAVELYRQVLAGLAGPQKDSFQKVLTDALARRQG